MCELRKHNIEINSKRTETAQIGQTKPSGQNQEETQDKYSYYAVHLLPTGKTSNRNRPTVQKKHLTKWCSMSSERWGTSAVHEVCIVSMLRAQDHIANQVFMSRHEKHEQENKQQT